MRVTRVKYRQSGPVIKYKLHRRGKNGARKRDDEGGEEKKTKQEKERVEEEERADPRGGEGAIGWKYDSLPLSRAPRKFTATVIDIGTAYSVLRAAVR